MTPAAWYPDPSRTHELRYWDGQQWTEHVSDNGQTSVSPLTPPPAPVQQPQAPPQQAQYPQQQYAPQQYIPQQHYAPQQQAPVHSGGDVFVAPILVLDRTFSGWDSAFSTTILDGAGQPLAYANENKASAGRMAFNLLVVNTSAFEEHHVMVSGPDGRHLFGCDRPMALSSHACVVRDPSGTEIGRVTKAKGDRLMDLWAPTGYQGCVMKEPLPTLFDAQGVEVAHATEKPHRKMGFGEFTQRYTVQVDRPLQGILGPLALTALLYVGI